MFDCAKSCGACPEASEPRNQPNSHDDARGADTLIHGVREHGFVVEGVPAMGLKKERRTACVVDVTTIRVSAACDDEDHAKAGDRLWAATQAEANECVATADANVARDDTRLNAWSGRQ